MTRCSLQVLRKTDGGSRGFGFVTFKDETSVEKCLVMQHTLNGRTCALLLRAPNPMIQVSGLCKHFGRKSLVVQHMLKVPLRFQAGRVDAYHMYM